MKKSSLFITLSLFSLIFICCKPESKDEAAQTEPAGLDLVWAKHYLDSVNTLFSEQFKNGDSIALTAWYWPDAEMLFTNEEPITGAGILHTWDAMIKLGLPYFTFKTTDIRGSEKFIIETGSYELKDAKEALVDRGKYIVVWENRDNVWKIIKDTGNTSLPAAK